MVSYVPVPPTHSILCVCPIQPVPYRTSGTVPWYPMYLSHQHTQSYVSVQSNLSHIGQVGQSYGILSVPPTHSILCVRPIPPVPCRTSGTVQWNPVRPIPSVPCRTSGTVLWNLTCPTNTLNPMCPSNPTCPM